MAQIIKEFTFEASHQLPQHKGKCGRHHGHSYKTQIVFEGPINEAAGSPSQGMVIDFYDIKEAWTPIEEKNLDHHHLNHTIPLEFQPPTAENIARYIFNYFALCKLPVVEVRLWETATGCAIVKEKDVYG